MVSINCGLVHPVRIPIALCITCCIFSSLRVTICVVNWDVGWDVATAEEVGRVVVAVEVIRRVVGRLMVASPMILTVRFQTRVRKASHPMFTQSSLLMTVRISMVGSISIAMVSIGRISGVFVAVDARVGI